MKKCNKCNKAFHKPCFKNTYNGRSKLICFDCEFKVSKEVETKINDYFKASKKREEIGQIDDKKYVVKNKAKNEILLRLPKALTKKQKEILHKSILHANIVKGITFNDDLCYNDPDCTPEMNRADLEPGLEKLSKYNKVIYYAFKERSRKGEYAPLEIIEDDIQVSH
jgi:hypothetical protein